MQAVSNKDGRQSPCDTGVTKKVLSTSPDYVVLDVCLDSANYSEERCLCHINIRMWLLGTELETAEHRAWCLTPL